MILLKYCNTGRLGFYIVHLCGWPGCIFVSDYIVRAGWVYFCVKLHRLWMIWVYLLCQSVWQNYADDNMSVFCMSNQKCVVVYIFGQTRHNLMYKWICIIIWEWSRECCWQNRTYMWEWHQCTHIHINMDWNFLSNIINNKRLSLVDLKLHSSYDKFFTGISVIQYWHHIVRKESFYGRCY